MHTASRVDKIMKFKASVLDSPALEYVMQGKGRQPHLRNHPPGFSAIHCNNNSNDAMILCFLNPGGGSCDNYVWRVSGFWPRGLLLS